MIVMDPVGGMVSPLLIVVSAVGAESGRLVSMFIVKFTSSGADVITGLVVGATGVATALRALGPFVGFGMSTLKM